MDYQPPFHSARIEAKPAQLLIVQREAVGHMFDYQVMRRLMLLGEDKEAMYRIYMSMLEAYAMLEEGQRKRVERPDFVLLHAELEEACAGQSMANLRHAISLKDQELVALTEAHEVDQDRIEAMKETIARLRVLFFEQAARGHEGIQQTLAEVEQLTMTQEERDLAVVVPDAAKRRGLIQRFGDSESADEAVHYVVGSMVSDPDIPLTAAEARSEKFLKKIQPFLHHNEGDSLSNLKDLAQKYFGTPRKRKKKAEE